MEFDPNSNPPCYKSTDETLLIKQDDEIRVSIHKQRVFAFQMFIFSKNNFQVKLIGTRVDATDIFAIGTLMDDYLGLCTTE